MAPTRSLRSVDPVFTEVAKAVFGDEVDPRELWDIAKALDPADVHIDEPVDLERARRRKKVAQTGLATSTVAVAGGLHALSGTRYEHQVRVARTLGKPLPQPGRVAHAIGRVGQGVADKLHLTPKQAVVAGTAGWVGLHTTELAGDALALHAQNAALKNAQANINARTPKAPVAKAVALRPVNPQALRRVGTVKAARPGTVAIGKGEIEIVSKAVSFDEDKMQVFGWASVAVVDGVEVLDLQGDVINVEEIEKAAYDYVLDSRVGGDMHDRVSKLADSPRQTAELIESMVFTPEKLGAMGLAEDALPHGWWTGYQVYDVQQWQDVKDGKRLGFSVHGTGVREAIGKALEETGPNRRPSMTQRLAGTKAQMHTERAYNAAREYNRASDPHNFRPGFAQRPATAVERRHNPQFRVVHEPKLIQQPADNARAARAGEEMTRSMDLAQRFRRVAGLRRVPLVKGERIRELRRRTDAALNPPPVRRHPVHSSALRSIGYQPQTRRLAVEMNSRPDEPYEYRMKPKAARAAEHAPSLGHHYATEIRGKAKRATSYTVADRARLFTHPPRQDAS